MKLLQRTSQVIALLAFLGSSQASATSTSSAASHSPTGETYPDGFDITRSWSTLSRYQNADFGVPKGVPRGCELSQAHVLHRHAQRFPTPEFHDSGVMTNFHSKLVNYTKTHPSRTVGHGPLEFLNDWKYLIGTDLLLPSGAATEHAAGADFWNRYGRLLYRSEPGAVAWDPELNRYPNGTARPKPVFRTTSKSRILESARWWLSGFFDNIGANSSYSQYDLVIMSEDDEYNTTLAFTDGACPTDYDVSNNQADTQANDFVSRYSKKTVARLSAFLPPGFNLTAMDILGMQNLCTYETAAFGTSSFCSLFTEQEWRDYAYNTDLRYYLNSSFGSPTGRAHGIGYLLELAARLKSKLIYTSDTNINSSYDDNTAQFPLHQPFYLDMSHENAITSTLTALGLDHFRYGPDGRLPGSVEHAVPRTFELSKVTPYGARFVTEIWTCPSNTSFDGLGSTLYENPDLSESPNTRDYIRFSLNNAPLPLDGLRGCDESSKNGFCPVDTFLRAVPLLKKDAMYQYSCFGNYTAGPVGNGRPA